MLGAYRIEHEGRAFYGNVALREHHLFGRDGAAYVYDPATMAVRPLPPGLDGLIGRLAANPGCLISAEAMTALEEAGLVDDGAPAAGTGGAPPAPAPAEPEAAPPLRAVTSIALFVAQTCNLRCVYCYGEGGEYSEPGMMDEKTALAAVDWLIDNSLDEPEVQIGFFGGEPLLNFKLMKKVAAYARQRGAAAGKRVAFSMTTNGTLLNEEIIAFLAAEGINPMISYDGPAEYQDAQRPMASGRGSHARVTANLDKLRKVFPHLRGRATLYGDGDPFEVQKGMEEAGFTTCIVSKASPVLARSEKPAEPSSEEMAKSDRMVAFNRGKVGKVLDAIRGRTLPEGNPPSMIGDLKRLARRDKKRHGCGVGKDLAGVSATGDIYPCHRFVGLPYMRLGNIRDGMPREENGYHRAIVEDSPVCGSCWARYMCGGGCMYLNRTATGDPRRPDRMDCRERLATFDEILHVFTQLDESDWTYIDGVIARAEKARLHPAQAERD